MFRNFTKKQWIGFKSSTSGLNGAMIFFDLLHFYFVFVVVIVGPMFTF